MPALKKGGGRKQKMWTSAKKNKLEKGCLASCIIFRNKQCETVLASLLPYIHKERVSAPVCRIKEHHKEANVTLHYPWRRFLKEIVLWANMWSPQIQSAQTKGISNRAGPIFWCVHWNEGVSCCSEWKWIRKRESWEPDTSVIICIIIVNWYEWCSVDAKLLTAVETAFLHEMCSFPCRFVVSSYFSAQCQWVRAR